MVEHLQGWSSTYGDRHIYVKRKTKQALSGLVQWSDVFLKVGNQEPVDVSQSDGVNCGQPPLSENGHLLVFVKAEAEWGDGTTAHKAERCRTGCLLRGPRMALEECPS